MASIHPVEKDRQVIVSESERDTARRLIENAKYSPWGFNYIARESPKDAKDALGMSLTTTMLVSALVLTFTFPAFINPPNSILAEDNESMVFRFWWYLQFFSVLFSFVTLIWYAMILIYMQHLPNPAVGPFLVLVKTPWVLSNILFVVSIILALGACLTALHPLVASTDWSVAMALTGVAVALSLYMLLSTESWYSKFIVATVSCATAEENTKQHDEKLTTQSTC